MLDVTSALPLGLAKATVQRNQTTDENPVPQEVEIEIPKGKTENTVASLVRDRLKTP